ncbi:MAG: N-acetyltransferase [Lachnospiraceae bacterium]|nr:N-acetyltransferase [Lachnospiraceae bacterium]
MISIRDVRVEDAQELLRIYAWYVTDTAVSFETEVPALAEFAERIRSRLGKYPYIVAEENGRAVGYAYASAFVGRAAYDRSCELTIYLDRSRRGEGTGRLLYEEMERRLKEKGFTNMYACIGDPVGEEDEHLTRDSERFHARMGFEKIGTFHKCGHKFGRWYNMIWMEKIIAEHGEV